MKKLITFFKKLFNQQKSDNKENNIQLIVDRYDGENIYYKLIIY